MRKEGPHGQIDHAQLPGLSFDRVRFDIKKQQPSDSQKHQGIADVEYHLVKQHEKHHKCVADHSSVESQIMVPQRPRNIRNSAQKSGRRTWSCAFPEKMIHVVIRRVDRPLIQKQHHTEGNCTDQQIKQNFSALIMILRQTLSSSNHRILSFTPWHRQ